MNTQWDKNLLDDNEIDAFMVRFFDARTVDAFRGLPLGVMRADMWRYAALLIHGGVYADVDCKCILPAVEWSLPISDSEVAPSVPKLIVGLENNVHFCNWAFASSPGHPVLARSLELIVERYYRGIDFSDDHFVHYHSGPGVWTDAICQMLDTRLNPADIFASDELCARARAAGIVLLDRMAFGGRFCENQYGSTTFGDDWLSWTQQQSALRKQLEESSRPL